MKTPITYYGGKQRLTGTILKLLPEHKLYCEPFFWGWAVFFAKQPSQIEVINDINGHVVNFFKVMKRNYPILRILIQSTPHSRQMHRQAEFVLRHPDHFDEITHARAFRTQTTMWFGSSLFTGYSFERGSHRTYQKTSNKRLKFWKHLSKRLDQVDIENIDALQVIETRDSPDTFFYLDPPYINCNQSHYKGYTEKDFANLLELLSKVKGKFLLSSYKSPILEKYIQKYKRLTMDIDGHTMVNSKVLKAKTEVLTSNYPIFFS